VHVIDFLLKERTRSGVAIAMPNQKIINTGWGPACMPTKKGGLKAALFNMAIKAV